MHITIGNSNTDNDTLFTESRCERVVHGKTQVPLKKVVANFIKGRNKTHTSSIFPEKNSVFQFQIRLKPLGMEREVLGFFLDISKDSIKKSALEDTEDRTLKCVELPTMKIRVTTLISDDGCNEQSLGEPREKTVHSQCLKIPKRKSIEPKTVLNYFDFLQYSNLEQFVDYNSHQNLVIKVQITY